MELSGRPAIASGAAAAFVVVVALTSCGEPAPLRPTGPPASPGDAVVRLFALSTADDPELDALRMLLDEPTVDQDRAAALDAVASLREFSRPSIVSESFLEVLDRAVVDVQADLPGGGTARLSFQALQIEDGTWRVVSIEVPGIEWPGLSSSGSGLTVSAPVDEPTR